MNLKDALNRNLELRELQTRVPGQDELAYSYPVTLAETDMIAYKAKKLSGDGEPSQGLTLALTVITKVVDAEGNPIFNDGDRTLLMKKVPQETIIDLVNEMAASVTIEESEGN
jgi:hypothetical protein